ncbi:hypothetical protein G7Y89_g10961 [Cudoniella acicularis]|uniref:Uncharacterized protein n=1 Tax=Cudoniella acicularis TaxID=354080 RepID=A0A8H4VY98_9HELO|nr:hypothetical protein G7Y89_g10961 [Cudoniella acicularis]
MEPKDQKRRLNWRALNENGIYYHPKIDPEFEKWQVQASIVAEGLLDFKKKLTPKSRKKIDNFFEVAKIPERSKRSSVDMEDYEEIYQVAAQDRRFEVAQKISRSAKNIRSAKEARWSAVIKYELFEQLIKSSRQEEGARFLEPRRYVDRVRVEEEDIWEEGRKNLQRTTFHGAPLLTAPKVDLYIALPIFSRESNATGFYRDDYIQNFTETLLARLEQTKNGNLISNPIKQIDSIRGMDEKHLVCFPSTVVEIKHHKVKKSEISKCYHQAANAAATTLSMLGRLSYLSLSPVAAGGIQPAVAFTFIGNKYRVWVAYIDRNSGRESGKGRLLEYRMVCIAKGDLLSVWDTVQLCRIIENVHYWTARHFRPWVSSCISRWKAAVYETNLGNEALIGTVKDLKDLKEDEEDDDDDDDDEDNEDDDYEDDKETLGDEYSDASDEEEIRLKYDITDEEESSMSEGKRTSVHYSNNEDLTFSGESEIESIEEADPIYFAERLTRSGGKNFSQFPSKKGTKVGTPGSSRTTPRPQRRRNASTLSPEPHDKSRRLLFPRKSDMLELPIVGASSIMDKFIQTACYALALVSATIAFHILRQLFFYNKNEPPIVFHWIPFLGNTITYGMEPYKFFAACREKHGDIFTFILLGQKTTVYLGIDGNEFILNGKLKDVNAEEVYAPLTTPVFGSDVVYDCANAKLMEQKKFVKFGLTDQALQSHVPLIENEVVEYIKGSPRFKGSSGTIDLPAAMAEITIFTAARALQGEEVRQKLSAEFAELYHDLDKGFTAINFMLPWAPLPHNRKRDIARETMKSIYMEIINKRRKSRDEEGFDMIWNLMNCVYKDGTAIPDKEIAHMMITLLMAGQHTSSASSSWIMLRLASQPKIAEQLFQEQIQNLGKGSVKGLLPIQYSDLAKLPLLQNAIKETLRMHGSIHSIMRKVKNPLAVPGTQYVVPTGHILLASPGVTALSDQFFPDAKSWNPHRWENRVEEEQDADFIDYGYGAVNKGTKSPYLPFGAGRHRCIGEKFAYMNLAVIISTLVRNFKLFNLEGKEGVPPTDFSSLFSRPSMPAHIRWERRFPENE